MRIAETLNEGLKREYTVVIPAADVAKRIDAQVASVAARIRMPGFRPGKVPHNLVRKMHGDQLRAEALSEAVQAGVTQLITEQKLRPAMQPSVDLTSADADKDVELKVAMEVLPTFETSAVEGIELEKLVVEPTEAEVEEALNRLAGQQKRFEPAAEGHAAARGDVVVMDFVGTVDGEPFDGGKGEGMQIELGSGRLIPGFEDQLEGVRAGGSRTVSVTFPQDYTVPYLKGRAAEFAVTVSEVRTAADIAIDDELAKGFGVENLEKLKQLLKEQLAGELSSLSRTHLKRKLLDHLAATNDFAVPDAMVEAGLPLFLEHYGANIAARSRPFEGVEPALDALAAAGVCLAICTNKPHRLATALVDALGWGGRFAANLGGDSLPVRKPDAAHVLGTVAAAGGDRFRAVAAGAVGAARWPPWRLSRHRAGRARRWRRPCRGRR